MANYLEKIRENQKILEERLKKNQVRDEEKELIAVKEAAVDYLVNLVEKCQESNRIVKKIVFTPNRNVVQVNIDVIDINLPKAEEMIKILLPYEEFGSSSFMQLHEAFCPEDLNDDKWEESDNPNKLAKVFKTEAADGFFKIECGRCYSDLEFVINS